MIQVGPGATSTLGALPPLCYRPRLLMNSSDFDSPLVTPLTRRRFLLSASVCAGLALTARYSSHALAQPRYGTNPFALGIASGDPSPDGMVLWTRLAPEPLLGGGMAPQDVLVRWQLASDEGMKKIVQRGTALATAALGHSVHVEVEGLKPARHYWYQFETNGVLSPIGRTRTMPALDARPDRLRFAFASCQNWATGYYAAYRHMAQEDLDLVVHLGDYIYEGVPSENNARKIVLARDVRDEPMTVHQYRLRHALYRLDPDLQHAHANFPFIVTWDDHEVENNYAADRDQNGSPPEEFLVRRAAAYQVYYEHMPLRRSSMPHGPYAQLYRRLTFGDLAQFHVLDTRQYRSAQANGDGNKPRNAASLDPNRVFMGGAQEKWLMSGLTQSHARWNVLAQQIIMTQFGHLSADGTNYSMDAWDGYPVERARLMNFLATQKPHNPIVLSGDSHTNLISDLKADFDKPKSPIVGVEFAGTSISSNGSSKRAQEAVEKDVAAQPHLKWFEGTKRGYISCTVERKQWRSDVLQVADVKDAASPVRVGPSWVVREGEPGVHPA